MRTLTSQIALLAVAAVITTACAHPHQESNAAVDAANEAKQAAAPTSADAADIVELAPSPGEAPDAAVIGDGSISHAALLTAPQRHEGDSENDETRKPAAVLEFARIAPHQVVLEMEAGGGYYTELLSMAVGPEGKVYMQNPAAFDAFLGDMVGKRVDGRLSNVTPVKSQFDALPVDDASVDVVTWFLGPHELYYTPEGAPEGLGDAASAYAEIARVLKPGGVFVALDHAALAGSSSETGGTVHRIDPAIVIASAAKVGMTVEATSDLLANPADDHSMNVFAPEIRRQTDRFLIRFRKPG